MRVLSHNPAPGQAAARPQLLDHCAARLVGIDNPVTVSYTADSAVILLIANINGVAP